MTPLFDCSPAMAAKLARCEAMAREQAHAPALWTTAIDHRILCGIQERLVLADRTNRALSEWYRSLNA